MAWLHRFLNSSGLHNWRISPQLYWLYRERAREPGHCHDPQMLRIPTSPKCCAQQIYLRRLGEEGMEPKGEGGGETLGSEPAPRAPIKNPQLLNPLRPIQVSLASGLLPQPSHPRWPKRSQTIQLLCNQVKNKLWLVHLDEGTLTAQIWPEKLG